MSKRRVVITGLGAITPLGNDIDSTWTSLLAGQSGAAPITSFDTTDIACKFGALVKNFDATAYLSRKI